MVDKPQPSYYSRVGRHASQNDISVITITDTARRRVAMTTTGC